MPAIKNKSTAKFPWNTLFSHASFIEYPRMRDPQVAAWIRDRVASVQRTIAPEAIELLLGRVGTSLRDLAMEIEKLVIYVGDRQSITVDDVNDVSGTGKTYTIFELQRAIGKRDTVAAITIATRMMEMERVDMLIITMLTRYFVTLFRLCDLRGVVTDQGEIARQAGIAPYFVGEYLDVLQRYHPSQIEQALAALAQADATIKSTSTDPLTILQTMLIRIMG
jgi:DNA polymerase-3 subunit delta